MKLPSQHFRWKLWMRQADLFTAAFTWTDLHVAECMSENTLTQLVFRDEISACF